MNKTILSMSIALGFLLFSSTRADVISTMDFDNQTSFSFGFAFSELGSPTTTNTTTGGGNNSANAFGLTADLTPAAGSTFAGFGGGFGLFGANLLPNPPSSTGDFDLDFDVRLDGIADTSNPIASTVQITFRYPDTVADGDDNGNDFADSIFRVDVPFEIDAINGTYQSLSVNLGDGNVVTGAGSTPENSLLSFNDFVNGDPNIAGRDFSLVNEILLSFVVNDGLQFDFDNDNSLMIDNVVFQQVPEPSGLAVLSAIAVVGLLRRRRF